MRKWNKLLAMLLAMVMAFGLTATAFAEGNDTDSGTDTPAADTDSAGKDTAGGEDDEKDEKEKTNEDAVQEALDQLFSDENKTDDAATADRNKADETAPADEDKIDDTVPTDEIDYSGVADWALEEVKHVVGELKLMTVRETGLEPTAITTRAEMVAALYKLAGSPTVEGGNKFKDVADDAVYKNAVIWANNNGIVMGANTEGTIFNPDGELDRKQIAVFLYRYAKNVAKIDVTVEGGKLDGFADVDSVDVWAVEGLNWAVDKELIKGSGNKLNPQDLAERQMTAVLLSRYIQNILPPAESKK
ncbi:MAG: S-layer homology domain-containing protein [Oscillospiraceae bacterium]|nr:S-layer homology domain-containing protein [Oscillospiraceae bacterium]